MDMKSSAPKDIKQGTLFLWLWRGYLRRHMWVLAIIVVLMMIEGSMVGGLAWMMQPLFDGGLCRWEQKPIVDGGRYRLGIIFDPRRALRGAPGPHDQNCQTIRS
jgi:hypothetical protein